MTWFMFCSLAKLFVHFTLDELNNFIIGKLFAHNDTPFCVKVILLHNW